MVQFFQESTTSQRKHKRAQAVCQKSWMYIRVFVTPVVLLSRGVKVRLVRCTCTDNKRRINMIRLLERWGRCYVTTLLFRRSCSVSFRCDFTRPKSDKILSNPWFNLKGSGWVSDFNVKIVQFCANHRCGSRYNHDLSAPSHHSMKEVFQLI